MPTVAKKVARPVESTEVPPEDSPFAKGSPDFQPDAAVKAIAPDMPKSHAETEFILKALLKTYTSTGILVSAFSPSDGYLIVQNAEELTESWRQLLDTNPKMRKTMKKTIEGGAWGAVISAHLMVAVPIFNNHRDKFTHLVKPKNRDEPTADRTAA